MVRPASWKPLSIPKINVFLKLPKTIGTGADMKNAVIVKSFRNGLTLYLDSDLDFGQLLEEVAGKFNESKEFSLMPLWRFLLRAGSCPLRKRTA